MSRRLQKPPQSCLRALRRSLANLHAGSRLPRIGQALPLFSLAPGADLNETSLQRARRLGWVFALRYAGRHRTTAEMYYMDGRYRLASICDGRRPSVYAPFLTRPGARGPGASRLLIVPSLDLVAFWQPRRGKDLLIVRPLTRRTSWRTRSWNELLPHLHGVIANRLGHDDRPQRFRRLRPGPALKAK